MMQRSFEEAFDWINIIHPLTEEFPTTGERDVYRYNLSGITLEVPWCMLQPDIWRSLVLGYYEGSERAAINETIKVGDTVLEIGAGIGFIGTMCAKNLGARVVSVEADEKLIPLIKRNHAINGVDIPIIHAAGSDTEGSMIFYRQPSFWASSTVPLPGSTAHVVTARSLNSLLIDHDPDILIVDIEGGEGTIFRGFHPKRIRSIIVEVHKPQIGLRAIANCFNDLREAEFGYDPVGSSGSNIVFSRQY